MESSNSKCSIFGQSICSTGVCLLQSRMMTCKPQLKIVLLLLLLAPPPVVLLYTNNSTLLCSTYLASVRSHLKFFVGDKVNNKVLRRNTCFKLLETSCYRNKQLCKVSIIHIIFYSVAACLSQQQQTLVARPRFALGQ